MYMNIRVGKENRIILAQRESLLHFISALKKRAFSTKLTKERNKLHMKF